MNIVLTGSLGNISKPLTQELVQKGHSVTVISSNPEKQKDIEALNAKAAIGKLEDINFLASTFAGAEAVYCMIPMNMNEVRQQAYMRKVANNYVQAIRHRPSTYKDMTVKEAFEVSAGWVFMELAKKVGRERYLHNLNEIGYGNSAVSNEADFWNFGPLTISPRNQVELLVKAYESKLPFSRRNLKILKRVMVTEQTNGYTIRSKTGWGNQSGKDIGWWIGYVERTDNVYFFATRITKDRNTPNGNFMKCRIDITKEILRQLGAL